MARRSNNTQSNAMMVVFLALGLAAAKASSAFVPGNSLVQNGVKVAGGIALAAFTKNKTAQAVGLGMAAEGGYNLISPVISPIIAKALPAATLRGISSGINYQTVPQTADRGLYV